MEKEYDMSKTQKGQALIELIIFAFVLASLFYWLIETHDIGSEKIKKYRKFK